MTKRVLNSEPAESVGKWDRSKILKIKTPKNELYDMYHNKGMSVSSIAKSIGAKTNTTYLHMKRIGIKLRPQKTSMKFGEDSPNWKGGVMIVDGYERYSSGPREGELVHRVIAEKALGRKLSPREVVHHINNDRACNRNSNLLICSMSYHIWLHRQIDITNNKQLFGRATKC